MIKINIYYVYIWFVKETGEVFYVGKGHGDRYKTMKKRSSELMFYKNNYSFKRIKSLLQRCRDYRKRNNFVSRVGIR